MDNSNTWIPLITKLYTILPVEILSNLCFLCPDVPGHGQSGYRKDGNYALPDYSIDLIRFVNEIGWKQFMLMGHSMVMNNTDVIHVHKYEISNEKLIDFKFIYLFFVRVEQ
jgi:hypothetical protein